MQTECKENLRQLSGLLEQLNPEQYQYPSPLLSGGSIGQHMRHILEFYICLFEAYYLQLPKVNYDKRKRDKSIEQKPELARDTIKKIMEFLDKVSISGNTILEANFSCKKDHVNTIKTSFRRELAYCLEHSIHHQALIKIGLIDQGINNKVNRNFGVAPSTVKSRLKPKIGKKSSIT